MPAIVLQGQKQGVGVPHCVHAYTAARSHTRRLKPQASATQRATITALPGWKCGGWEPVVRMCAAWST